MTCNAYKPGGVVGLSLAGANIYSDLLGIAAPLLQLGTLRSIELTGNSLYNAIPSEIGLLAALTSIKLGTTFFGGRAILP